MKFNEIDPDFIVHRKFTGPAEILKPVIFWDGTQYCCLLGPDDTQGLMTTADSPVNVLNAWNDALLTRLLIGNKNDFIVKHVKSVIINASRLEKVQEMIDVLGEQ